MATDEDNGDDLSTTDCDCSEKTSMNNLQKQDHAQLKDDQFEEKWKTMPHEVEFIDDASSTDDQNNTLMERGPWKNSICLVMSLLELMNAYNLELSVQAAIKKHCKSEDKTQTQSFVA